MPLPTLHLTPHGDGVNRHSTVTHYQRPTVTQLQEGGTGGEVSEILFFSAKSKRRPSLIYSMQIIPVCLSIVARRKGVSATRRRGLNWTPISLLVGHPCKLFHTSARAMVLGPQDAFLRLTKCGCEVMPSIIWTISAHPIKLHFVASIARPAHAPTDASPDTSR